MTIFDDEFNRLFKKMSSSFFNIDDIFEEFKTNGTQSGPYYYGYTMTVGPDGKPIVKEYGNVKPQGLPSSNSREPMVDTIVNEKEKLVKLVAEMPFGFSSSISLKTSSSIPFLYEAFAVFSSTLCFIGTLT